MCANGTRRGREGLLSRCIRAAPAWESGWSQTGSCSYGRTSEFSRGMASSPRSDPRRIALRYHASQRRPSSPFHVAASSPQTTHRPADTAIAAAGSRGRQGEEEGRALARRRLDPDLAAVPFDDPLHDGEADPGALVLVVGVEPAGTSRRSGRSTPPRSRSRCPAPRTRHQPFRRSAEIRISGGPSGRRYLIALPIRFAKTCSSCVGSAMTARHRTDRDARAGLAGVGPRARRSAPATTAPASVGSSGFAVVSTRETWSRSSISACIRFPPSTMNPMYSSASWSSLPLYRRSRSWEKRDDRSGAAPGGRGSPRTRTAAAPRSTAGVPPRPGAARCRPSRNPVIRTRSRRAVELPDGMFSTTWIIVPSRRRRNRPVLLDPPLALRSRSSSAA